MAEYGCMSQVNTWGHASSRAGTGLVLDALWLVVVEARDDVLGIHHRDDTVKRVHLGDVIVDEKGLGHRSRVREA